MNLKSIEINSRPRNQSEILVRWESGEITKLLFNSQFPLAAEDSYKQAIISLMASKTDISSFDELFGLFSWWFTRHNLPMPLMVVTFYDGERERIGARIKSLREQQNMEAKQLSQLTGIDAANISRIEQGKTSAGLDTLVKIANALGYTLDFVKPDKTNNYD
ncbi:MAG: helix-turn-helix transcriptional regulator [[Clostridium] fimetarium]|nr:helix-turn-helix transcriptional regulator [Alistipes timonensis]MCM1405004.1 helix-turn-helix transcriptional regulator [[Clostridium] fimetarium]